MYKGFVKALHATHPLTQCWSKKFMLPNSEPRVKEINPVPSVRGVIKSHSKGPGYKEGLRTRVIGAIDLQ